VQRNRCSFITKQMVGRNEGLDLPADSRFYTYAESEKLYHHCCIDGRVQIPFPSGIIKTASGSSAIERKIERKIEEKRRRDKPDGKCSHRGDNTEDGTVSRIYPAKVNRVSGTHKSIGKKRSNKVRIEFAVNVKGKR